MEAVLYVQILVQQILVNQKVYVCLDMEETCCVQIPVLPMPVKSNLNASLGMVAGIYVQRCAQPML
jgi:hypothetical protein